MRILHLTDRLSDRGGAYEHLLGVIEALREEGHVVRLAVGEDERCARLTRIFRATEVGRGRSVRPPASARIDRLENGR